MKIKIIQIFVLFSTPNLLTVGAHRIGGPKNIRNDNDGEVSKLPQKGRDDVACPSDHSCPSDSTCIVKKDGELNCICPSSGREVVSGVTCDTLESFDSSITPNSEDEGCDQSERAGCGKNADCGVHNGESICTCPVIGAVPKGQDCDISGAEDLTVSKGGSVTRTIGEDRKLSASGCDDLQGWVDSYGDGCDWYETNDSPGCPKYGNMYIGANGAPKDGCCHCDGGIRNSDELFTVIFMADMENQYRSHHDDWCYKIANYVKNFGGTNTYFDDHPNIKVDPKLVIHGGDLSDTTYGWDFTADELFDRTYQQFYDANIPMISILGNHDETNRIPHSQADSFVRKSFQKAKALSSDFSFDEVVKDSTSKNSYYIAEFKGLQLATVNDALESTGNQWTTFKNKLDTTKPALFFSHRPLGDQKSEEAKLGSHLIDYISKFPNPNHYAGHDHEYYKQYTGGFTSHVAPYLHKKEKSASGTYHPTGFLALLVSPTEGVLETKVINYNYQSVTGCWVDGSVCGVGTTCNQCCHNNRDALGTKCGGAKWDDGTLCGSGTTCKYCENESTYWYGKAFTACGNEPKWGDGTICALGTTCNACRNPSTYWWGKAITACGSEPKWGDGTRCLAGTSCNACQNGYSWWYGKVGHHCGQEPCWGRGTVCGTGTTCNNCCGSADCPWYQFGVCTCN